MQIAINNTHESSGLTKVCDFSIQTNGVMIKALTSRLYSAPISSIVRELASNALDACTHTPMRINIPSLLEPSFRIRDYGPGLSATQMAEVFTRFGESTKRDTNSQIGGFGLGAKSPFAIVNSYNIISFNGGNKTTYIASLTDNGMPSLHVVSSQPTTETGLEIVVPAKPSSAWAEALQQIQFFQPRPTILGHDFTYPTPIHKDSSYFVILDASPSILVGPVAYPLDLTKLSRFGNLPYTLKFAIGEIEVTASREEIVYSPATIALLRKRLASAEAHYQTIIHSLIAKCSTAPEAWQILKNSPLYQTFNLHTKDGTTFEINKDSVRFPSKDPCHKVSYRTRQRNIRWTSSTLETPFDLHSDDAVFLADDTRKWQDRIEAHLCANPIDKKANILLCPPSTASTLDLLGIPYTPITSIPYNKPLRNAPRPIRYRVISERGTLTVSHATFTHYLKVDADLNYNGHRLTYSLYNLMCGRMGINFCIVPPAFKGKLDGMLNIAPLYLDTVTTFAATRAKDIANQAAFSATVLPHKSPFYAALAAHSLVPPVPSSHTNNPPEHDFKWDDIRAFTSVQMPSATINYEKEIYNALNKYPTLKCLNSKGWLPDDIVPLTKIVDLVVKE